MRTLRSGHTLVELAVVVALLSICAVAAVQGTAPVQRMNAGFRARGAAAQELLMAREYLRQDLGVAASALPRPDGSLRIVREAAAVAGRGNGGNGADPGVDYRLEQGRLVREDRLTRERAVIAEGIAAFKTERVAGSETRVEVAAQGERKGEPPFHSFTLVWTRS
jgi:prepilin-type N-terminal cleavage/methylation domain-containing protein